MAGGLPSIRAVWQAWGWQAPEILESFGPARTVLTLPLSRSCVSGAMGPGEYCQKIVVFLTETAATAGEIAIHLGLPQSQVNAYLDTLSAEGALEQETDGQGDVRYRLKA